MEGGGSMCVCEVVCRARKVPSHKWLLPLPVNHYQVQMSRCSHCGVSRNGLFLFSGRLSLKAKVEQVTHSTK